MNKINFIGLGVSLLFVPGIAMTQNTPGTQRDDQAMESLEEVLVTAQRRSERLKDVPVTVTLVSNERLASAGIENMTGLAQVVPALKVAYAGAWVQPSLRGIGSANAGPGVSSSIATYVDGFYIPSPNPSGFNFAGIENIQVLAGPQGTLFGRNATAGAIIISTKGPSNELELDADVGYGRWNTVKGNMFLAGPLGDNVSMSLFASGGRSDGFLKNVITGEDADKSDNSSVRGKIKVEPTSRISLTLGGEYAYVNDPSSLNFSPYKGQSIGVLFFGAPAVTERDKVANYGFSKGKESAYAVDFTGEFAMDFATLRSYSQYRHDKLFNRYNYEGSAAAPVYLKYDVFEDTYSQEFNLSSHPGKFNWITGLFLYSNTGKTDDFELGSAGPNPDFFFFFYGKQKTTTVAPYADATYQIGNLFLTGGIRYSVDTAQKDHIDVTQTFYTTPQITFREWTPRAVMRYEFSDSANIYASFSKGSKPGIYNANSADSSPARPEKLTAYEVGSKFAVADWHAEASTFYYDYKDLQVATYSQGVSFTRNAGKVEIYGAQLHLAGAITDSLMLDAGLAYTHGIYKEFTGVQIYQWDPVAGVITSSGDVSGRPIMRSPRVSGNISLTYDTPVAGGDLKLNANTSYQSESYFDPNGATEQGSFALVNASVAYTPANSHATFSVLGTNLTDKTYLRSTLGTAIGFGQIYGEPASVFFKVGYRY